MILNFIIYNHYKLYKLYSNMRKFYVSCIQVVQVVQGFVTLHGFGFSNFARGPITSLTASDTSANSESEVSIELFENDRMQRCRCFRGARKRQKLLSQRCGMQRVLIPTQTNIFTAKLVRVTRGSEKVGLVKVGLVKATAIKFESRRLSPHANYQNCPSL